MTNEQILEELKKLKMHSSQVTEEEQNSINNEVEELDESINIYNEKIAKLEAKIADSSNYQYNYENEERDFTVELLQESFENQLEVMDREDTEYNNLQDLATNILEDYNLEIQELNVQIEAIERRLRKNEVAVRKNIGIRLTEQELTDLQNDLATKKARVAECEEMKEKYVADLNNYSELIATNNRKREIVVGKQNSLNRIVENKKNNPKTVDNFKLRTDKDELANLKAGLEALKSRKEYIVYNPNEEIDKLIAAVSANAGIADETLSTPEENMADNLINLYNQPFEDMENEELNTELPVNEEEKEEDKTVIAPIPVPVPQMEDISSHSDNDVVADTTEEKTEDEEITDMYINPSDLDEEREAEIEDAPEELKEKKKDNFFKKHWKKFVAVGLTVVVVASLIKGCHKTTELEKNDLPKDDSYSQTDEGIIEENDNDFNKNYDVADTPTVKPTTKKETTDSSQPSTPIQEEEKTEISDPISEVAKPDIPDNPDIPVTPEPVVPDIPDEPIEEKETVELEAGEKTADLNDIINGNINEDTVISHGDAIGKTTTGGAELKDYTEEGNAVVEKNKQVEVETNRSLEDIKQSIADYMGADVDDLEFTDAGNQWLDEITSGKTR